MTPDTFPIGGRVGFGITLGFLALAVLLGLLAVVRRIRRSRAAAAPPPKGQKPDAADPGLVLDDPSFLPPMPPMPASEAPPAPTPPEAPPAAPVGEAPALGSAASGAADEPPQLADALLGGAAPGAEVGAPGAGLTAGALDFGGEVPSQLIDDPASTDLFPAAGGGAVELDDSFVPGSVPPPVRLTPDPEPESLGEGAFSETHSFVTGEPEAAGEPEEGRGAGLLDMGPLDAPEAPPGSEGDGEQADEVFLAEMQRKLAEDPNNLEALEWMAFMQFSRDEVDQAILTYLRLIEQEPRKPDYRFYLAQSYEKAGYLAEAKQTFQQVLQLDAAPVMADQVRQRLARLEGGGAAGDAANRDVHELMMAPAQDLAAVGDSNELSTVLTQYTAGDGSGTAELERKLAQDPGNVQLLDWLAFMHYSNNDDGKARDAYERLIALDPSNQSAYYYLGNVYVRMDDGPKALTRWHHLLERFPRGRFARKTRRRIAEVEADLTARGIPLPDTGSGGGTPAAGPAPVDASPAPISEQPAPGEAGPADTLEAALQASLASGAGSDAGGGLISEIGQDAVAAAHEMLGEDGAAPAPVSSDASSAASEALSELGSVVRFPPAEDTGAGVVPVPRTPSAPEPPAPSGDALAVTGEGGGDAGPPPIDVAAALRSGDIGQLEAAFLQDPTSVTVHRKLAGAYLKARRFEDAVAAYEDLAATHQGPAPLFDVGRACLAAGMPAEAVRRFEQLLERYPESREAGSALQLLVKARSAQRDGAPSPASLAPRRPQEPAEPVAPAERAAAPEPAEYPAPAEHAAPETGAVGAPGASAPGADVPGADVPGAANPAAANPAAAATPAAVAPLAAAAATSAAVASPAAAGSGAAAGDPMVPRIGHERFQALMTTFLQEDRERWTRYARKVGGYSAAVLSSVEKLLSREPENIGAREFLAFLYLSQGKGGAAYKVFQSLADRRPGDARYVLYQGNALLTEGDGTGAVRHWNEAVQMGVETSAGLMAAFLVKTLKG